MSRSKYFALCMSQSVKWLRQCLANPSAGMTRTHIALIKLAISKKGA